MQVQLVNCVRCKEEIPISGNTLSKRGTRRYLTCPKCGYRMDKTEIEISQVKAGTSKKSAFHNIEDTFNSKFHTNVKVPEPENNLSRPVEQTKVNETQNEVLTPKTKKTQYTKVVKSIFKSIITFPQYLGHFVLDVFGRNQAKDTSALIMGWLIMVTIVLIWKGVISVQSLEMIWRFFFPVK